MSGKDLLKLLRKNGWTLIRINGSHHHMGKGGKIVTVPVHGSHDIDKGLLDRLLKQAGLK